MPENGPKMALKPHQTFNHHVQFQTTGRFCAVSIESQVRQLVIAGAGELAAN